MDVIRLNESKHTAKGGQGYWLTTDQSEGS